MSKFLFDAIKPHLVDIVTAHLLNMDRMCSFTTRCTAMSTEIDLFPITMQEIEDGEIKFVMENNLIWKVYIK